MIAKDKQVNSLEQKCLDLISNLFKIEESTEDLNVKFKVRQAKLVLDEFYEFIYQNENKILPRS